MVYYGVLSKGCEGCRRRKVKCDQRKPSCQKCEKTGYPCPGYRDLGTLLFRDDSARTIRRVCKQRRNTQQQNKHQEYISQPKAGLMLPVEDMGMCFYFSKYATHEVPLSPDYQTWLEASLSGSDTISQALKAAIMATGMAGMANTSASPNIIATSNAIYAQAVEMTNKNLGCLDTATSDITLLTVIVLGLFELISFASTKQYHFWESHVKGAMALLNLRGPEQFTRERGAQIYVQVRSQILMVCMQQKMPIPNESFRIVSNFQSSNIRRQWQKQHLSSPASIFETSIRVVSLYNDLHCSRADSQLILQRARRIDEDLRQWKHLLPKHWLYEVDTTSSSHTYPSIWIAEIWNCWRVIRIMVQQIIVEIGLKDKTATNIDIANAVSIIRQLSTDICDSVSVFSQTPRILSLLRPLCVVVLEGEVDLEIRKHAAAHLYEIASTMGIRQAAILADSIQQLPSIEATERNSRWQIPLIPLC